MVRLTIILVAAIYAAMVLWGQPPGSDVEVARTAPLDTPLMAASADGEPEPVALAPVEPVPAPAPKAGPKIGPEEAVRMALLAGEAPQPRPSSEPVAETVAASATPIWYVTGSRVNLRAGPSTQDAVVGQVGLGDSAEVLSDPEADWIRIRVAETGTEGYIYGRFLSEDPA